MPLPFIGGLLAKAMPFVKGIMTKAGGALSKIGRAVAPVANKIGGFVKNNIGTIGKVATALMGVGGNRGEPRVEEPPDDSEVRRKHDAGNVELDPPPPRNHQMHIPALTSSSPTRSITVPAPRLPGPAPPTSVDLHHRGHMNRRERAMMEFNPPPNRVIGPHTPRPGPQHIAIAPGLAPPPIRMPLGGGSYRPTARSPPMADATIERINGLRAIGGPLMNKVAGQLSQLDRTINGMRPAI